ncbi:MAG TPA: RNA methyltransferase [Syntrophomonadaceae bacterium]|nr:RNA methyltransferase [Syntrophomonadaceae bacterium]HQD91201.1 RNA methyltransferase [Syntrophomonadaceae bacterium]
MRYLTSRDNPLIKETIKLKQKKYRQQTGTFLIEGERMLREALKSPQLLVRVFVDDSFEAPDELRDLNIEVYQVTANMMKAIADTEHPQGVAAVVSIPPYQPAYLSDQTAMLLLLDRISDPGNLGTIIRTAWALDIDGILLTAGCADPFSPKVVRASMGGIFHVPINTVDRDSVDELLNNGYRMIVATPDTKTSIYQIDWQGAIICVIGSEAHGVAQEWLSRATQKVVIPINQKVDSLNAAVSCAIIMAEARRQRVAHL